ncbi:MAG: hypothetical protein Q8N88_06650, partial [Nanoarchaeota archaeon]|nr:hypothetical protein [Nanoarchaeota archaeon]
MTEQKFNLVSKFKPAGSQPEAINKLTDGINDGMNFQTLLGVTGSGKSLDFKENIFIINKSGFIEKIKIGEFVEKNLTFPNKINDTEYQEIRDSRTISFNLQNFKTEAKEILEISKHKEDIIYEIILDDHSKIKVTKDHNCFKFNNCELNLCKTKELKIGDYIPTSNIFLFPEKTLNFINLLDYNPNFKISISELIKKYDPNFKIILNLLRETERAPKWKLHQILNKTKERGVSIDQFYKYIKILNIDLNQSNQYIKIITKGKDKCHPLIDINEDFLIFSGLYIAEGHNTG